MHTYKQKYFCDCPFDSSDASVMCLFARSAFLDQSRVMTSICHACNCYSWALMMTELPLYLDIDIKKTRLRYV